MATGELFGWLLIHVIGGFICGIIAYRALEDKDQLGIGALVDVENMGFCKDGVTRYYFFTNNAGEQCVYFKHGSLTDAERGVNYER